MDNFPKFTASESSRQGANHQNELTNTEHTFNIPNIDRTNTQSQQNVEQAFKALYQTVSASIDDVHGAFDFAAQVYIDTMEYQIRHLKYTIGHLKGATGKAARAFFNETFNRPLRKLRDIKALNYQLRNLREFLPERVLKLDELCGYLDIAMECKEACDNIIESGYFDLSSVSTEVVFRTGAHVAANTVAPAIGRWAIDKIADFTVSTGLYMLSAEAIVAMASMSGAPIVIPVVSASILTRAIRAIIVSKYIVGPLWHCIEDNAKPYILEWFHREGVATDVDSLQTFVYNNTAEKIFLEILGPQIITPNGHDLTESKQASLFHINIAPLLAPTSATVAAPMLVPETSTVAAPPILAPETSIVAAPILAPATSTVIAQDVLPDNHNRHVIHLIKPTQYTPSPDLKIFSGTQIPINYQFPRPVNPMRTQIGFTQGPNGEINFKSAVSAKINSHTDLGATASILDLGGNRNGIGLSIRGSHRPDSYNTSLGGSIGFTHQPNNNGIQLSGSIASDDITVTTSLQTSATEKKLNIDMKINTPLGAAIAVAVATGAGVAYGIKKLTDPKPIPWLHNNGESNQEIDNLEKMLKGMRSGNLTDKKKRQLIPQIEKCAKIPALDEQARENLHAMRFWLLNAKDTEGNAIKRWYDDHTVEKEKQFCADQYESGIGRIETLVHENKIFAARDECLALCRKFQQKAIKATFDEVYASLYNPQVLQAHAFLLLEQNRLAEANTFFQEAFSFDRSFSKYDYQNAFAEKKIQLGYFEDAQKTVKNTIESIRSLSPYAQCQKERAHYLSIVAEINKPVADHNAAYMAEHLNNMPPASQVKLAEQVIHEYDRMRGDLYRENYQIDANHKIIEQEKQILKYENDMMLKSIIAREHPLVSAQHVKTPANNLFYTRALELASRLDNLAELQQILTQELQRMQAKSLNNNLTTTPNLSDQKTVADTSGIDNVSRLQATRDATYFLGVTGNSDQKNFAINTLSEVLSEDALSNSDSAKCHHLLGNLILSKQNPGRLDKSLALRHYRASFNLDSSCEDNVLALSDMYCERLEFSIAKDVLQQYSKKMSHIGKKIQEKLTQVKIGIARFELFILEVTAFVIDSFLHFLANNRHINHNIARLAYHMQDVTNFATLVAKKWVEGQLRYLGGLNQFVQLAHGIVAFADIVLHAMILSAKHNETLEKWKPTLELWQPRLQAAHFALALAGFGMVAHECYTKSQFLWGKLMISSVGVIVPIAGYLDRDYQKLRDEGNAPTTRMYMFKEDILKTLTHPVVGFSIFCYVFQDQIGSAAGAIGKVLLPSPVDGSTVPVDGSTLQSISDGLQYAGDKLAQIPDIIIANPWTALGVAVVVVGGTVVGTVYYYSWPGWYKQHIADAKKHIELAKTDSKQTEYHHDEAEQHLNDVLKPGHYPNDPEASSLLAQIHVARIINDPEDKWKTKALDICNQQLIKKPKSFKFKELRISTLFSTLANPDLSNKQRDENVEQIRKEADWLIKNKPREVAGWWSKMALDEASSNFSAALQSLDDLKNSGINFHPKAHENFNEIQTRIINRMTSYVNEIIMHEQAVMDFIDQRLNEKAFQLYEHHDGLTIGKIVWRDSQAFSVQEHGWQMCVTADKKQPGDLVQENGKFFRVGGDGQFTQIENNIIRLQEFSRLLALNFSAKAVFEFVTTAKTSHIWREVLIHAPQKDAWMLQFLDGINTWKDKGKKSFENFNTQLSQAIPGKLRDELMEGFEQFHQQRKIILDQASQRITKSEQQRLDTSLHQLIEKQKNKTLATLAKYKQEIVDLQKNGYHHQHNEFLEAVDGAIVELESHFDQHITYSYNIMWAKVTADVACYLVGLFQQTLSDAWTLSQQGNSRPPLPNWLYCSRTSTTTTSQLQLQGRKKLLLHAAPVTQKMQNKNNNIQNELLLFSKPSSGIASNSKMVQNTGQKKYKLLF